MVSHNCFGADLPVLMHECMRSGARMERWWFMDSLSYVRYALRGRTQKFGISDLCTFLNVTPEPQPHRALQDAIMLANILRSIKDMIHESATLWGTSAALGEIPVQAIRGIGNKTAGDLRRHDICSVFDLYSEVMKDGLPFTNQNIEEVVRALSQGYMPPSQVKCISESAIDWVRKLGI